MKLPRAWKVTKHERSLLTPDAGQHHLCIRQRPPWTPPPQVFTPVHLLKKIVGSRFTISSPRFQNNGVKIHRRGKSVRSRFTKLKCLLRQDSPHFRKNRSRFTIVSPCTSSERCFFLPLWGCNMTSQTLYNALCKLLRQCVVVCVHGIQCEIVKLIIHELGITV